MLILIQCDKLALCTISMFYCLLIHTRRQHSGIKLNAVFLCGIGELRTMVLIIIGNYMLSTVIYSGWRSQRYRLSVRRPWWTKV